MHVKTLAKVKGIPRAEVNVAPGQDSGARQVTAYVKAVDALEATVVVCSLRMTPAEADDLADRLRAAAAEARALPDPMRAVNVESSARPSSLTNTATVSPSVLPPMTTEAAVQGEVERIAVLGQADPEAAHGAERRLHEAVLEAVAARLCARPEVCAEAALRTRALTFPRW